MKRITFRMALAQILVLLPAVCFAAPIAEVIGVKGEVSLVVAGKATPIPAGAKLERGAEIRTGNPGRAKLRFIDGSILIVSDASTLKIEQFEMSDQGQRRAAQMALDVGLISQSVRPADGGSWTVRTPTAVTAVRGTEYLVEVTSDKVTAVHVQTGSVSVEPAPEPGALSDQTPQVRTRSIPARRFMSPVLLDKPNLGTSCGMDGQCGDSKPWQQERVNALMNRLSGV